MKRFFLRQVPFIIGTMLLIPRVAAESTGTDVYVPCPEWAEGDSWETRSVDEFRTETVSSLVKSRGGARIVVAEKRVAQQTWVDPRARRKVLPPPIVLSSENVYEVIGQGIVLRQQTGNVVNMAFDPPVPFCGQIPENVSYTSKVAVMGNSSVSEGTVTYRALGKQAVTVPAGTFEATVVETKTTIGPAPPAGAPSTELATTMYVAEKVGVVKIVTRSTAPRPVMSAAPNPDLERAMKDGLEKMDKGEDIADTLAEMQSMAGGEGQQYETVESEAVTELIAYRSSK